MASCQGEEERLWARSPTPPPPKPGRSWRGRGGSGDCLLRTRGTTQLVSGRLAKSTRFGVDKGRALPFEYRPSDCRYSHMERILDTEYPLDFIEGQRRVVPRPIFLFQ